MPFSLILGGLLFVEHVVYFWISTDSLAEKLQREDKRKDEFLVNTSHELRNPLQAISNILQVVLDDRNDPVSQKQRERIEIARLVSSRMNRMLDDLIDITRLKEKTIRLESRPVYLQSIAAGTLDMISIMLEGKPVQLLVDIDKDFPPVMADSERLIQILFNLLHNAVKYTDEGFIRIRAVRHNQMAEIQVEDSGIGIAEQDLRHIFLPYEQAQHHDEKNRGVFGLGLSICKELVGTIHVTSQPGKGSLFRFTLPLAGESGPDLGLDSGSIAGEQPVSALLIIPPEPAVSAGTGALDASAPKILLVDDDIVNLNALAETLESDGYAITYATSAEQALAATMKEQYDLVIADVMMPRMSGYKLTRKLRERFDLTELPILLLTARTRTEDIVTGFRAGPMIM